jgi:hypothetical protein
VTLVGKELQELSDVVSRCFIPAGLELPDKGDNVRKSRCECQWAHRCGLYRLFRKSFVTLNLAS